MFIDFREEGVGEKEGGKEGVGGGERERDV